MHDKSTNASPDTFWLAKAAEYLPSLLLAGMLRGDATLAVEWLREDRLAEPEAVLRSHGFKYRAVALAQLRDEAPKTAATIKTTMLTCLAPMTSGGDR